MFEPFVYVYTLKYVQINTTKFIFIESSSEEVFQTPYVGQRFAVGDSHDCDCRLGLGPGIGHGDTDLHSKVDRLALFNSLFDIILFLRHTDSSAETWVTK